MESSNNTYLSNLMILKQDQSGTSEIAKHLNTGNDRSL